MKVDNLSKSGIRSAIINTSKSLIGCKVCCLGKSVFNIQGSRGNSKNLDIFLDNHQGNE